MKLTARMLRKIIAEEVTKVLTENLQPGEMIDADEKFDLIQPGDSVKIDGIPCTVVKFDPLFAKLIYTVTGKSIKKSLDSRSAVAWEPGEEPEIEIQWLGRGKAPTGVRSAPRKKTPSVYD